MIKIGVSGACGKMGRRIIELSKKDKDLNIVFGLEKEGYPDLGSSVEAVPVISDLNRIKECDCLIEFSSVQATLEHLSCLVKENKCGVIGTTGLGLKEQDRIKEAAKSIPIVFSPNMSVGVNLLFKLLKISAGLLKGYDAFIQEAHHVHKKDAPSGTAKKLAQIINEQGFNIKIDDIKSIREDEIVGDHRVVFESGVDKIEFFHSAKTRDIFAEGALTAAKWIIGKAPGLYSMDDVLFSGV
ncbi:MAG: 4-hydroxy-tetrahydrodipicolinate reductase [Candidatus Omnitrophica bacterium]|nr:4-hydroxy-tetrahydrodipicolinate reductase [Candidatus Omnitrophota bacterium]